MCGASSLVSSWARVASFCWLLFCGLDQVPLTAQSTNSGLGQSESKPSVELSLSKVSSELRETLKDLKDKYPKALEESENLRSEVKRLSEELTALSSSSANWEKESKRLTASVKSLMTQFEELQAASDERARIDAEAIATARTERDEAKAWNLWAWIGGAILGGLTGLVVGLIL